jgi:hypothetical protein
MSTAGAATKAIMNTVAAVKSVGIMITPDQPMYNRLFVLVIQLQKRDHKDALEYEDWICVCILWPANLAPEEITN